MNLAFVMKANVISTSASQYGVVLFCQTEDGENVIVYSNVAPMLRVLSDKEAKAFCLNRKNFDIDFALSRLPEFEVNIEEGDDGKFRLDFHREVDEKPKAKQQ